MKEAVQECLVCDSTHSKIVVTTSTMMGTDKEEWTFRQCENCELVFLSPRVSIENLSTYYNENYIPYRGASAWGKFADFVERSQNTIDSKRVKVVKKYMQPQAKSILDVGCGKPSFLLKVKDELGIECIGIDFSDIGWKNDKEKFRSLRLSVGEIDSLPEGLKADVITMWHYLEHDYNPQETLEQLSNSQNRGAKLIIEVPNFDSYTRRKHGKYWSGYHSPRHTALYNTRNISQLLNSTGWRVEEVLSYGSLDPYSLDWMSRMEKANIDWSASMEPHFINYVLGKLIRPRYFFDKKSSLGFMTVIANNEKA